MKIMCIDRRRSSGLRFSKVSDLVSSTGKSARRGGWAAGEMHVGAEEHVWNGVEEERSCGELVLFCSWCSHLLYITVKWWRDFCLDSVAVHKQDGAGRRSLALMLEDDLPRSCWSLSICGASLLRLLCQMTFIFRKSFLLILPVSESGLDLADCFRSQLMPERSMVWGLDQTTFGGLVPAEIFLWIP